MAKRRTSHSPQFKAEAAVEATREAHTVSELARKFSVHLSLIGPWKKRGTRPYPRSPTGWTTTSPSTTTSASTSPWPTPLRLRSTGRPDTRLDPLRAGRQESIFKPMTNAVLDSDRSACSSRRALLCGWRRLRRQPSGGATPFPLAHPRPFSHTPVGAENPVRRLHSLQGYRHTPRRDRPTSRRAYSTALFVQLTGYTSAMSGTAEQ